MMKRKMNASPPNKGQGALEYLLLIGGAVLIATVVLVIILSTSNSTNSIISNNILTYQNQITLNATGGGGGNCGNGTIDAGESCDGANLNGQTCVSQGFPLGGTLACSAGCGSFNTTGCNTPPGNPSFASFSASTGVGSGQLGVNWSVTNFGAAGPNVIKAWTTDPGITTPAQFDSTGGEAFSYSTISAATSSNTFTGLPPNVGYFVYMKACNTTACTLSSLATATSSYSSIAFEGELFDGQVGESCLRTVAGAAYSGGTALAYESSTCGTTLTDGVSSFVVNVDPAITSPTPFKVMVRAFKAAAPAQSLDIEGTTLNIIASNPPVWRPGVFTTNVVTLTGGANTVDITFPAAAGIPAYAIDMVLLTTDTACAPANVSPNFEDPCA